MSDGFRFIPPDLNSPNNNVDSRDIGFGRVGEVEETTISNTNLDGANAYFCQSCNTTFTSSKIINTCIFCGSNSLVNADSFSYQDTYKLPFLKSYDECASTYKKVVKNNFFLPSFMRGSGVLNRIKKIYIPCSLYDINISGDVKFIGANELDKKKKVPVQSFELMYNTNFDYNKILVSNYSNIPSDIINSINDYNMDNLSLDNSIDDTCYIMSNNNTLSDINNMAIKSSLGIIKSNINYTFKKLKTNNLEVHEVSNKKILVPAYLLNVKYKDKKYFYLMNGQTGKVYSYFDINNSNILIISICIFVVIFLIVLLLAYIF